jgi:hypothetical protein
LRAAAITLLLALGFIAGWPKVSPKIVRALPKSLAGVVRQLPEVQGKLLAPFGPAAGAFGIYTQSWPLFTTTGGIRHRMWVEARAKRADSWTLLYRPHDAEHAYLSDTLEYRRVRTIWHPHHDWVAEGYPALTRWLARRICLDFPRFDRVRVRQERIEILPRGTGFRGTGTFDRETEYSRRELGL